MLFGERLRELRSDKDITQKELGDAVGVSDRVIGYYESSDRFPRDEETLKNIADFFDVSLDFLVGRAGAASQLKGTFSQEDALSSKIETLNDESKKELEQFIHFLKIKEEMDKGKDEPSSTLERNA